MEYADVEKLKAPFVERFWEKVQKTDSCWMWTASKRYKGYGAFIWKDKDGRIIQGRAHRFSWTIHKGDIPEGIFVLHHCDQPACVNPEHLFLGTNQDNVNDKMKKGRHVKAETYGPGKYKRGKDHHRTKLTSDTILRIRNDYPSLSFSRIAKKYSISISHAYAIVKRKAWKHVK